MTSEEKEREEDRGNMSGGREMRPRREGKSNSNPQIVYLIEIDDQVTLLPVIQVNLMNKDQTELC